MTTLPNMARPSPASAPPSLDHYHPMGIGDVLDTAFNVFRRHFVLFAGISALAALPVLVIEVLAALLTPTMPLSPVFTQDPSLRPFQGFFQASQALSSGGGFAITFVQTILGIWRDGAIITAVIELFLGRPVTIRGAYRQAFGRSPSILLAGIIVSLVIGLSILPAFALFLVPFIGPLIALVLVCIIVAALAPRWSMATAAIVAEHASGRAALGRSWHLTSDRYWRVFGVCFFLQALVWCVSLVPSYLVLGLLFVLPPGPLTFAAYAVLSQVLQIALHPIGDIALTYLYLDVRARKEAFDIDLRAGQVLTETQAAKLAAEPIVV